jgi:hypothetical protein
MYPNTITVFFNQRRKELSLMATKKTSKVEKAEAPEAGAEATTKTKTPKGPKTRKVHHYVSLREAGADDKLPKQAQVLSETLAAAGKKGFTKDEFVAALEGKLETRQPIERIIAYYQKKLETMGLVKVSTFEEEVAENKEAA